MNAQGGGNNSMGIQQMDPAQIEQLKVRQMQQAAMNGQMGGSKCHFAPVTPGCLY